MTTHDESPIIRTTSRRMGKGIAIVVILIGIGAAILLPNWNNMIKNPPPVSTIVIKKTVTPEEGTMMERPEQATTTTKAAGGGGGGGTSAAKEGTAPAGGGGGATTTITILAGASTQGSPDYDPDDAKVPLNNNLVWVNKDTVPHTATSGTGSQDPNSGKILDTSIIEGGAQSAPQQLKGAKQGDQISYYCQIHPYMTSKLTVAAATSGGGGAAAGPSAATTTGGGGGGPTLTVLQGAATQGSPDYKPDPMTVKKGDKITVKNEDSAPHTVTSGKGASDANAGKVFDTSIIDPGGTAEIDTSSVNAGEYDFFCQVHPFMSGKLKVG
jgi:plastocyanin